MKSRILPGSLKKAALVAAFFIAARTQAIELDEAPGLKPADARVQRLFDQAVKLQRRSKAAVEPLKSILTELSLYHDNEEASYLSDVGAEGKRSGPIPLAPWALRRLAQQDMARGDFEEAILHYHELGERFSGLKVIEPSDGPEAGSERAEAASLRGEIEAFLEFAKKSGAKDVKDALDTRLETLQEKFAGEISPSGTSYGRLALRYLREALDLDKASPKAWRKANLAFAKRESSAELKAEVMKDIEKKP
jgi:hypothetical protein